MLPKWQRHKSHIAMGCLLVKEQGPVSKGSYQGFKNVPGINVFHALLIM